MTLDHDNGQMEGEVLAGRFAGRRLSELEPDDLQALLDEVEGDEENLTLLLAYLERRGTDPEGSSAPPPDPMTMSEEDAYRILDLAPGASTDEVRAAYRRLMRKVHPDLGGSPALASLLNAASSGSTRAECAPLFLSDITLHRMEIRPAPEHQFGLKNSTERLSPGSTAPERIRARLLSIEDQNRFLWSRVVFWSCGGPSQGSVLP